MANTRKRDLIQSNMIEPTPDLNKPPGSRRLWLFLLVYPLHIFEEIRGVGASHGINLSLKQFFILSGGACLLLAISILLPQKLRFPPLLEIVFGTVVVLDALLHIPNCLNILVY